MWALIKDNKIEEMYRFPKSIILNNVRYPSNMFTKYTDSEKEAIDIYPVLDNGTRGDDRFENTDGPTYTFDAANKRVTTAYNVTERKLDDTTTSEKDYKGNAIVNLGLKSEAKKLAKRRANDLIKRFNWLVERYTYDNSKTIPSAVSIYVGNIRSDCATICTGIDNASDMTAFKKLYSDGTIDKWSDDYDVQVYIR
jgi:hypothetical protein